MTPKQVRIFVETSSIERIREVLDHLQKLKNRRPLTELPEPAVAGQETRIVSRAAVLPPEKSAADPELQSMQAKQTRALPAVQRPATGKAPAAAKPSASIAPAPSGATIS